MLLGIAIIAFSGVIEIQLEHIGNLESQYLPLIWGLLIPVIGALLVVYGFLRRENQERR